MEDEHENSQVTKSTTRQHSSKRRLLPRILSDEQQRETLEKLKEIIATEDPRVVVYNLDSLCSAMPAQSKRVVLSALCTRGNIQLFQKTTEIFSDINLVDASGRTILHEIMTENACPIRFCKEMLSHVGMKFNVRDSVHKTPLMYCIENLSRAIHEIPYTTLLYNLLVCMRKEYLEEIPMNQQEQSEEETRNPLIWQTKKTTSILHLAVDMDNHLAVEVLLRFGKEEETPEDWKTLLCVDAQDGLSHSLLLRSIIRKNDKVSSTLLSQGADPLFKAIDGQEPYQEVLRQHNSVLLSQMQDILRNGFDSPTQQLRSAASEEKLNQRKTFLNKANSSFFGGMAAFDQKEGLLEFFHNLNCAVEYYRSVSAGSTLRQKIHFGKARESLANLFSGAIVETKAESDDSKPGGNVTLPHWARIFHQKLLLTGTLISSEEITHYEQLTQDFLRIGTKSKDFHAVLCAQSFLDYIVSHRIDPCNSLIGIEVSTSINEHVDLLQSMYNVGRSLGLFSKTFQHVRSLQPTPGEELITLLKQWKTDYSLSELDLRDKLGGLIEIYELEKELREVWKNNRRHFAEPGDLLIIIDESPLNPISTDASSTIFRFVRCASVPEKQKVSKSAGQHIGQKLWVYDRPEELIRREIDWRLVVPLQTKVVEKLSSPVALNSITKYMSTLVESLVDKFAKELSLLAEHVTNTIITDSNIKMDLLDQCQEPLSLLNRTGCVIDELVLLQQQLQNSIDSFHSHPLYKSSLAIFQIRYEQINTYGQGLGLFTPTKSSELLKLEKLSFTRSVRHQICLLKNNVNSSLSFVTVIQRLTPPEDLSSGESNLLPLPAWWESIITPYVDEYLNKFDQYIPVGDGRLNTNQLNQNIKLLSDIVSVEDPYKVAELESLISAKLFPLLDYYITKAFAYTTTEEENGGNEFSSSVNSTWHTQLRKDIQLLLTIKCPLSSTEKQNQDTEGIYLAEIIQQEFVSRMEQYQALLASRKSKCITQPSLSGTLLRRKGKHLVRDLKKYLKSNPKLESCNFEGSNMFLKLVGWCKSSSNALHKASLSLLAQVAYPDEILPGSREVVRYEKLLPTILDLVRKGDIVVHNSVDFHDVKKGNYIASGSGGIVHECEYLGRDLVIKECSAEGLLFATMSEVRVEVALMSILSHPNIMTCFGAHLGRNPFLLMPKAPSCLENILLGKDGEPKPDFPWEIRYKIMYEIALGMEYIHSWGIIHRDLKSGNILLNDDYDCFITDFGLSRVEDVRMTLNLGTVFWMAPEVFSGDGSYTQAVDVFSFAILLWEIVCRTTPYPGMPTWAVPEKVVGGTRPDIPDYCPPDIRLLMESCWHQNPIQRPSFSEITEILNPFVVNPQRVQQSVPHPSRSLHLSFGKLSAPNSPVNSNLGIGHQRKKTMSPPLLDCDSDDADFESLVECE